MKYIHAYDKVILPIASIGACHNVTLCMEWNVDLADGWCVKCWDRGKNSSVSIMEAIEKRRKKRKSNYNINKVETRGRHIKNCTCEYHKSKGFI